MGDSLDIAVIGLAVGGDSAGDGQLGNIRRGRAVERDVIVASVGARHGSADIHRLAGAGVLVAKAATGTGHGQVVIVQHTVQAAVGDGLDIAVIDLAIGSDSAGDRQLGNVGRGRAVERDVIVASICTGDCSRHIDRLAGPRILVGKAAAGAGDAQVVVVQHAIQTTMGRRIAIAVIGLAVGGDHARDCPLGNVGLRRGIECHLVVLGIGAAQGPGDRHRFTGSSILVAELTGAAHGHAIVGHHAVQAATAQVALGHGVGIAVVDLVVGGDRSGNRPPVNVRRRGGIERDVVVASIGAGDCARHVDRLACTRVLVAELTGAAHGHIVTAHHAIQTATAQLALGHGIGIAVVDLVVGSDRSGNRSLVNVGLRGGIERDVVVIGIGTSDRASHIHRFALARVLVAELAGAAHGHAIVGHHAVQAATAQVALGHGVGIAVVDLVVGGDRSGNRPPVNVRRRGGIERDVVVASIGAGDCARHVDRLACTRVLVTELARATHRHAIAGHYAVQTATAQVATGHGIGIAVVDLVVGGDHARDCPLGNVGLGRAVERDVVVTRIGTAEGDAVDGHRLTQANVLVRKAAAGRLDCQIVIFQYTTIQPAMRAGRCRGIVDFAVSGDRGGDALGRNRVVAAGKIAHLVVIAAVAVEDGDAGDVQCFVRSGILVSEGKVGAASRKTIPCAQASHNDVRSHCIAQPRRAVIGLGHAVPSDLSDQQPLVDGVAGCKAEIRALLR